MEQKEKHFSLSWFFKWFLDNKAITVFLVTLLLGLNLFILSKISFLFSPVLDFLAVVMLPVILSGLLYYLLNFRCVSSGYSFALYLFQPIMQTIETRSTQIAVLWMSVYVPGSG